MSIPILNFEETCERLKSLKYPHQNNYKAMYSSWLGGITLDPELMLVPIDDHLVHRGDGVFEAFKSHDRHIYLLERHLKRLESSSARLHIDWPMSRDDLQEIILSTLKASQLDSALVRLYLARGPGGFTTNPYESIGSQLYIVATAFRAPSDEAFSQGVRAASSQVAVKDGFFSSVKSCNYLPNVLMKKEAIDKQVDYTIGVDSSGHLTEGSTENLGVITHGGELLIPGFGRTLEGTTVRRLMELVQPLIESGELSSVRNSSFTLKEAQEAAELFMIGTTIDVVPVIELDDCPIGNGRPGPWAQRFCQLIRKDMQEGPERTAY